jgi:hypothetical protein
MLAVVLLVLAIMSRRAGPAPCHALGRGFKSRPLCQATKQASIKRLAMNYGEGISLGFTFYATRALPSQVRALVR